MEVRDFWKTGMDEKTRQATRLWTLAQPSVSAFVSSVVRDFRDRDDVLQDIAVAVIESIDLYDTERPFVAWAIGVARNQIGLYLRRRQQNRVIFDDETVTALALAFSEMDREQNPRMIFLQDCIKLLERHATKLLDLRYAKDLKPDAIGKSLEMSASAVRKALQRVRDQLRNCIDRKSALDRRCI